MYFTHDSEKNKISEITFCKKPSNKMKFPTKHSKKSHQTNKSINKSINKSSKSDYFIKNENYLSGKNQPEIKNYKKIFASNNLKNENSQNFQIIDDVIDLNRIDRRFDQKNIFGVVNKRINKFSCISTENRKTHIGNKNITEKEFKTGQTNNKINENFNYNKNMLTSLLKNQNNTKNKPFKKFITCFNSKSYTRKESKENQKPVTRKRLIKRLTQGQNALSSREKSNNSISFNKNMHRKNDSIESYQNCIESINLQSKVSSYRYRKKSNSLCNESLKNILSKKFITNTDSNSFIKDSKNYSISKNSINTPISNINKDEIYSFDQNKNIFPFKQKNSNRSNYFNSSMQDSKCFIPLSNIFSKRDLNQNDSSMANGSQLTNLDKMYLSNRSKLLNISIEESNQLKVLPEQKSIKKSTTEIDSIKSKLFKFTIKYKNSTNSLKREENSSQSRTSKQSMKIYSE